MKAPQEVVLDEVLRAREERWRREEGGGPDRRRGLHAGRHQVALQEPAERGARDEPICRRCSVQDDLRHGRSAADDADDFLCDAVDVCADDERAEGVLERRRIERAAKFRDRVLRGDAPFVQDQHLGADLLDHLEDVRAVDDDPALGREPPHEAAKDERAADVEARNTARRTRSLPDRGAAPPR